MANGQRGFRAIRIEKFWSELPAKHDIGAISALNQQPYICIADCVIAAEADAI